MKNKSLLLVVVSFTILCFVPQNSFAQLFGDEEKKWERVLMEMKKVNSRLVSLKTKDVESLHSTQSKLQATQGEVLSQIQALQTLLPNIQGVVEQSNSELGRKISDVNAKLSDMEIYLKDELEKHNASQEESAQRLSAELNSKVDAMSGSISSKVDAMKSDLNTQVEAIRSEVGAQVNAMGETVGSRVDAIGKETSSYVDTMKNEMSNQVSTMRTETAAKLGDLKNAMALDVEKINQILALDMDKINQNMAADRLKINENMDAGLEKINQNIAQNMGKIDQNNKESFKSLESSTSDSLVGVKTLLSTQNNLMSSQDKKIGEAITLLAELTKVDEGATQQSALRQEAMLKSHREAVFAKFSEMDTGTKTMIDILSKGLEENQAVGAGVKDLNANLASVNENITINRAAISKFKSIFDTNITNLVKSQGDIQTQNEKVVKNANLLNQNLHVAETKINKLADTIKTLYAQSAENAKTVATLQDQVTQITGIIGQTDKKFDTLVETTKLLLASSQLMERKLDDVVLKVEGASTAAPDTGIADEKFTKLIDILKTIASKQDNVIQGVTAHEVSMTQILNVHESNVKQALEVYDNNIGGALKAYSQSLTEYEGNLIQAWNVHDKNTTLGQADQALLVESFKTAQEEIQKVLIELNKNTAEVNRSTNSLNMNTTELGRKTAEIGKKTAEIGRITSELMRSTSALSKSSASNGASQEEIKNTINDLRKKANVNISRNDDILKSLKKLQLQ